VIGVHEYGLCEAILTAVRRRAGGRSVAWIRVRAGARHGIDEAVMSQALRLIAAGTEAQDARFELVVVPVTVDCRACGQLGDSHDLLAVCVACGSDRVALRGGDELTLESIGYVAAGAAPAAG
jgi:hydrogenase nickel incorporation protein HypA/HybF